MNISVDGHTEGPEGFADWVEAWSEDYGLTLRWKYLVRINRRVGSKSASDYVRLRPTTYRSTA